MSCAVYQPQDGRRPNEGESKVLDYLKGLPAGHTVIRELRISSAYRDDLPTDENWKPNHKQPDFIVIGPEIGVVSVEVKQWNLRGNQYSWKSQSEVTRVDSRGSTKNIKNPYHQAYEYWQWLMDVLGGEGLKGGMTATSVCAFPTLGRSEMLNQMGDPSSLDQRQMRFNMDLGATIFAETVAEGDPLRWLRAQAQRSPQYTPASEAACDQLFQALLPALIVGRFDRQGERVELARLTREQERWAMSLDEQGLLMDIAGSGKTTVLLSKALHFVDRTAPSACRVLVTAYSEDLTRDLRQKLESKVSGDVAERYSRSISVKALPDVVRELAESFDIADTDSTPGGMARQVADRLFDSPAPVLFDAVFVDEVQDLDNDGLFILQALCPDRRLFFVGDASQRLYQKQPEFESLGLQPGSIALKASYRTYRTPRWIAELATRFVWSDPDTKRALVEQGYERDVDSASPITQAAELVRGEDEQDVLKEATLVVKRESDWGRPSDVLVITSERRAEAVVEALRAGGVRVRLGQPEGEEASVVVVPFEAAKGLERPHVVVTGVEDLYDSRRAPIHLDADERAEMEGFARRSIYVSLTRTMETLRIIYSDAHNPYVRQLVDIQSSLDEARATAR